MAALYMLPLGLVRLRNVWLSTWVRCKLEHRCWRACGEDVSFTDALIKIPEKGWPVDGNDVMHWQRMQRIWGILKKSLSWELDKEREGSTFGARRGQTNLHVTASHEMGCRWESHHRKIVHLSSSCQNL